MKFLIDEDLPRSLVNLFIEFKHHAQHVIDVGLRGSGDETIASHAIKNGLCLITGDFDFSDVRNYPPSKFHGIVVIVMPKYATAQTITSLVRNFLQQREIFDSLKGKLAIVEPNRVRIRKG